MKEFIIDSVNFSYHNHKVLSGVFAKIKTGEILGIFGRNGCGKTTLFKCIYGLFTNETGMVKINNVIIKRKDRWKYMSYLSQSSFLPDELRVEQAVRLFYTTQNACELYVDERISIMRKRKIRTLSGGEKRYLEFCIILNLGRSFVLLDEPFSKIEPKYIHLIRNKIKRDIHKTGIIISGHNHWEIREVCTRISIMNNGELKEIDNTDDALIKYHYFPGK